MRICAGFNLRTEQPPVDTRSAFAMGDHSDEQPLLQSVTVEDHDSAMLSLQSKTKSRNGLGKLNLG